MDDCVPKSTFHDQDPTDQQPNLICRTIIQSLSRHWPSLPALLLTGAIQRLCNVTKHQPLTETHDPSVLAGWVQLLLETASTKKGQQPSPSTEKGQQPSPSTEKGQQPSPSMARADKRKSIRSDSRAQSSAEAKVYNPTGLQLRACICTCSAALPACSGQTAAAVRQVLWQLLQQLQQDHPGEYADWGNIAQTLAASFQPHKEVKHTPIPEPSVPPSIDDLCAGQQRQQSLLEDLHTLADGTERSVKTSWVWYELQKPFLTCSPFLLGGPIFVPPPPPPPHESEHLF